MSSLVTVVIPCYNAEKWIWDCISSVIKQDYDELKIIIVDDCSTDKSLEVIEKLNRLFGGIKIIRNSVNIGECKTSALGFSEARGKYICRLSADDMFVKIDHISRQVKEMESYNLDWCYNNKNLIGETLKTATVSQTSWVPIPIRHSAKFFNFFDNLFLMFPRMCYLIAITRNPINSSTLMIRAETYNKMLSWDSSLRSCCDGMIIGKMLLCGLKARAIPTVGAFYRIHPGQATNTESSSRDLIFMKKELKDEISNNNHPIWMKMFVRIL